MSAGHAALSEAVRLYNTGLMSRMDVEKELLAWDRRKQQSETKQPSPPIIDLDRCADGVWRARARRN